MAHVLWFALLLVQGVNPAQVSEHLSFGAPSVGATGKRLIVREGYALLHDDDSKTPVWVSYRLTREYAIRKVARSNDYRPDPDLPLGCRAELSDYAGSGWSRGHFCPANDSGRSRKVMSECFYLSNMAPQDQTVNGGLWATIEDYAHQVARRFGDVTIITGPVYRRSLPDRSRKTVRIGLNQVAVPTWLYKIVVRREAGGRVRVLAFEVPNAPVRGGRAAVPQYLVSVRRVERDTGLNFLNALPTAVQDRVERPRPRKLWALGTGGWN